MRVSGRTIVTAFALGACALTATAIVVVQRSEPTRPRGPVAAGEAEATTDPIPTDESLDPTDPAAESVPTTAANRAARSRQLLTEAAASVAYLRNRYHVTADEAARRLALQEAATPLAARLATAFPAEYAGMWLDQAGGGVLTVAATRVDPVRATVAEEPDVAHVRVVPARYSLRQLGTAADRLAATLGLTAGTDVVVDQPGNALVVVTGDRIAADDPRLPGALSGAGVPARSQARTSAGAVPKACDPRYCAQAPMRGGIRLDIPRDDGTVGGCTSAFNVRDSRGRFYLLTAGHCVVGGRHTHVDNTWHQYLGPKVPVGVESSQPLARNAYPNDYAILPYQTGALSRWAYGATEAHRYSLLNYWCVADTRCTTPSHDLWVTGYVPLADIPVNSIACATGAAYTPSAGEKYVDSGAGTGYLPGTRCGQITGTTGGIDVNICARPGDSGQPLFFEAGGKALGILSDGDPGTGACTNPNEMNHYAPVETILADANARTGGTLGLRLATSGPLPLPVAPTKSPN